MGRSEIMNAVKRVLWSEQSEECEIEVVDRLSAGGLRVIRGDALRGLSPLNYLVLRDGTCIPLHRVRRIKCGERVLAERG
ncbi:MAG: RNA repair domain-containing protein [Fervidicoccaceae archaeon]